MNDEYQVKGRVRRLEQRKVWNVGLEHLPNHDSFDVEFSSSGKILLLTSYNMAGVVTGSEQFFYDDGGKLACSLEFNSKGGQTRKTTFLHQTDENRGITSSEVDGKFAGRVVEVHDGRLLLSWTSYDCNNLLLKEKIFKYDGNTLQTSESRFYLPDGSLNERWLSAYDAEGRIAETYGLNRDAQPLGDGKYKYEYDSEGRTSRLWTFNDLAPDGNASGLKIYEYTTDEAGNWIERRDFHKSRSDLKWSMKTTTRKLEYYP